MAEPITERFVNAHPVEAARVLERLDADTLAQFMATLPPTAAARILSHMTLDACGGCLRSLGEEGAGIVEHLPVSIAVPALRTLEADVTRRLLQALPKLASVPIGLALRYPEGTVGAVLNPQAATVQLGMTVGETVQIARRAPALLRRYVYVLGERQRLVGVLDVRECLLGSRGAKVRTLMRPDPVFLRARTSIAEAVADEAWDRFDVLPVVDRSQVFNGVVRRRVLEVAAGKGRRKKDPAAGLPGAALDLANLYWQASSTLFLGGRDGGDEERER